MRILADQNIAHLDALDLPIIAVDASQITPDTLGNVQPDALWVRSVTRVDKALFAHHMPQFVATATIGQEHIDRAFLDKAGIGFADAKGSSKTAVAQYVLACLWRALADGCLSMPFCLGIAGFGNIGQETARLARSAFGDAVEIVAYDPFLPSVAPLGPKQALLQCDALTLHMPLTKDTKHPTLHWLTAQFLTQLSPRTMVINTGRGGLIHPTVLQEDLLHTKRPYALDVFYNEPHIDHAIAPHLYIGTCHIAGYGRMGKTLGTQMVYNAHQAHFGNKRRDLTHLLPKRPRLKEVLADPLEYYDPLKDKARIGLANDAAAFYALRTQYPLRLEWQL